jgi:hypothetical protein
MLDPARGDDQAVHSGRVEHEAQGGNSKEESRKINRAKMWGRPVSRPRLV